MCKLCFLEQSVQSEKETWKPLVAQEYIRVAARHFISCIARPNRQH